MYGIAYNYGIFGNGFIGVYALTNSYNGNALWVDGSASSSAGAAAVFIGEVRVNGNFTATTKSFLIDHPADPANRYLEHACVESSERKTLYDGVGVADASGVLEVALPTYFEALDRDVRYLLTPIGAPAPNLHVREEVKAGRFVIAGAAAGQKICWCVTGVRNDAYAVAHPLAVERDKSAEEKGLYLNPIEHGQPADRGVHHAIAKQARERAAQAPNVPEQPT